MEANRIGAVEMHRKWRNALRFSALRLLLKSTPTDGLLTGAKESGGVRKSTPP